MMRSMRASIAGSAMPARLLEPFNAAACEEKKERSESPGVAEKLNRSTVMSKSEPSRRARYCTGSTIRNEASMPSVPRFLMNGMWCGSKVGSSIKNSMLKGSPLGSMRLPAVTAQRAVLAGAVRHRRHIGLAEYFVRHMAAERFKQREFIAAGRPFRHHVGVLKHRYGALIRAVHYGLVGPLEIKRVA